MHLGGSLQVYHLANTSHSAKNAREVAMPPTLVFGDYNDYNAAVDMTKTSTA